MPNLDISQAAKVLLLVAGTFMLVTAAGVGLRLWRQSRTERIRKWPLVATGLVGLVAIASLGVALSSHGWQERHMKRMAAEMASYLPPGSHRIKAVEASSSVSWTYLVPTTWDQISAAVAPHGGVHPHYAAPGCSITHSCGDDNNSLTFPDEQNGYGDGTFQRGITLVNTGPAGTEVSVGVIVED